MTPKRRERGNDVTQQKELLVMEMSESRFSLKWGQPLF
jgi:hypothetical protein